MDSLVNSVADPCSLSFAQHNPRLRAAVLVLAVQAAVAAVTGCSSDGSANGRTLLSDTIRPTAASPFGRARSGIVNDLLPAGMQGRVHAGVGSRTAIALAGQCPSAPVAFISDYNLDQVYEINAGGSVCATITGLAAPQGLATDHNGNLYVANTNASTIVEIDELRGRVVATYQDAGEFPADVAVDDRGDLAVTNIITTNDSPGNVVFYAASATGGPTGTAAARTYTSPRAIAFDESNRYVLFDDDDEFDTGQINAGAIAPGNFIGTKTITPLVLSNSITFPGGVQFTSANQPTILDQGSGTGGTIYTYRVSGTTLTVTGTTTLSATGDPVDDAFTPGSSFVLEADARFAQAGLYRFPAGGHPRQTVFFRGSLPIGAAINPTEQFVISR